MAEKYQFSVENGDIGSRIDLFLTQKLDFSRSFIRRHIREGGLTVNGRRETKPAHILREGDEVALVVREQQRELPEAEQNDLTVYHEDAHCMVVEKPAGMLTHPAGKRVSGTLVNALLGRFDTMGFSADICRPGIVHRLDEDTSGLLIVTKTPEAMKRFAQLFERRKIEKHYLALVGGKLEPKEGSIDAPLMRHGENMRISGHTKAKHALTHYRVLQYLCEKYSYLDIQIITGRTHQIRVHLNAIGHPIAGDKKYGSGAVNEECAQRYGLTRQFLHAHTLKFIHPFTREAMSFTSPLPDDLESVLHAMRGGETRKR